VALSGCAHQKTTTAQADGVPPCPRQTKTQAEVLKLYNDGVKTTKKGMMGEYHLTSSLEEGLELVEQAALHGYLPAMRTYSGHFISTGIVEMMPIMGFSPTDAAEEGMMWLMLRKHLGEKISAGDEETFRILLNPQLPFPKGFFQQSAGTAWYLQMLNPENLNRARKQAHAWRSCWEK